MGGKKLFCQWIINNEWQNMSREKRDIFFGEVIYEYLYFQNIYTNPYKNDRGSLFLEDIFWVYEPTLAPCWNSCLISNAGNVPAGPRPRQSFSPEKVSTSMLEPQALQSSRPAHVQFIPFHEITVIKWPLHDILITPVYS